MTNLYPSPPSTTTTLHSNNNIETTAQKHMPPRLQPSPAPVVPTECNFKLKLQQQPLRGRMCGFSAVNDRRIIDPPLVLQLVTSDATSVLESGLKSTNPTLCHISLWSSDRRTDCGAVLNPRHKGQSSKSQEKSSRKNGHTSYEDNQYCQTIIGTTTALPQVLVDVDGTPGVFFVFHDLSVRVQGSYTLRCQLLELSTKDGQLPVMVTRDVAFTHPLHMFSPKHFPGMGESTELSKCFARQGVPIHIRRDYSEDNLAPNH
ncbi:hypothetical protein BASA50_003209 [Batrachochytrium salamandrivorans]|uniref:Velvet domain-containing protein n=1 Tax=Batrachochytrium salamandrivorans TaxID=1357716 RepID=A0ABQ8FJ50_9FUNG|nr:hypothetical protein BASA50_003209 [Batrachochytrium salamandrivorans]